MEEQEKGLKEVKHHRRNNNVNQAVFPEFPRTKPPSRVDMEGPMSPATYVAEDGLFRHQ